MHAFLAKVARAARSPNIPFPYILSMRPGTVQQLHRKQYGDGAHILLVRSTILVTAPNGFQSLFVLIRRLLCPFSAVVCGSSLSSIRQLAAATIVP